MAGCNAKLSAHPHLVEQSAQLDVYEISAYPYTDTGPGHPIPTIILVPPNY